MRWTSFLLLFAAACGEPGAQLVFDIDGDLSARGRFFDAPWPSDLRVDAMGRPKLDGWPTNDNTILQGLLESAKERRGFPVLPVAWFRFTKPIAPRALDTLIPATRESPILLVDIDAKSPERLRLFPTVAKTLVRDDYVPENVLAVAPRQGFVLSPKRTYAFAVMQKAGDAAGAPLAQNGAMRAHPGHAAALDALAELGIDPNEVAAVTSFTTGDAVEEMHQIGNDVLARHRAEIHDLVVDPDDGASHARFCELTGKMKVPQFQRGMPPFDQGGSFVLGGDGVPVKQRDEEIPIALTLPKLAPMPAAGYPLALYFHGSGGLSGQVVDRGKREKGESEPKKGEGPAFVLAAHGFAAAGSAHPVNPERLPGASETQYLNFNNLASFRDIFRQGVIEQRLYIEALRTLEIPAATVAACNLPPAASYRFDPDKLVALGQSMGGMYTNLVGAVEPRIRAVVPTGAGGFWNYFITKTTLISGLDAFLTAALSVDKSELEFLHPSLYIVQVAWQPAEPLAYMPRLAHRPLPGHPARPVYEPVGKDDSYFPTALYDAIAITYDHQQAGQIVWPSMQEALALDGRSGILPYPVSQNRTSLAGAPPNNRYTGVVVQYEGDGYSDPHSIYAQLDAVKYQYGCFLETFIKTGVGVVPAPAPLGTPCPTP
jgi:hypothetical protein